MLCSTAGTSGQSRWSGRSFACLLVDAPICQHMCCRDRLRERVEQQKQSAEAMAAKVEEKQAMQRMNEQLESENAALLAELSLKEQALAGAGLPMDSQGELQLWSHSKGSDPHTRHPGRCRPAPELLF